MKNFTYLSIFSALQLSSLQSAEKVMQYQDFGPQAIAYGAIGSEWWQWDKSGNSEPHKQYPIKVVVYWDQTLDFTKKKFPVNALVEQDFRYLSYESAITHLESTISKLSESKLDTSRLQKTLVTLKKSKATTVKADEKSSNDRPPLQFFACTYRVVGIDPSTMQPSHGVCEIKLKDENTLTITKTANGQTKSAPLKWLDMGTKYAEIKPKLIAEFSEEDVIIFDWSATDGNYARLIGFHSKKGQKHKLPPAFELLEPLHMDLAIYHKMLKESLLKFKEAGNSEDMKKAQRLLDASSSKKEQ